MLIVNIFQHLPTDAGFAMKYLHTCALPTDPRSIFSLLEAFRKTIFFIENVYQDLSPQDHKVGTEEAESRRTRNSPCGLQKLLV
jgi:hypothetical protein